MTKNEEWWKMERTSTVAKGRANSGGGVAAALSASCAPGR